MFTTSCVLLYQNADSKCSSVDKILVAIQITYGYDLVYSTLVYWTTHCTHLIQHPQLATT